MSGQGGQSPHRVVGADRSFAGAVGGLAYRAQRRLGGQRLGFERRDALRHVDERGLEIVKRLSQPHVFFSRPLELERGMGQGDGGFGERVGGVPDKAAALSEASLQSAGSARSAPIALARAMMWALTSDFSPLR